jgi:predicted CopG family antitoxin
MSEKASVKLGKDILQRLKQLKVHPRETYDDVVRRLIEQWKSTQSE